MEEAADALDEGKDLIDDVIEKLQEAIGEQA